MNTEIFTTDESQHHHHVASLARLAAEWFDSRGPLIDFGCGDGYYLSEIYLTNGLLAEQVIGVEGTRKIANPLWANIVQWDLCHPLWLGLKGDVMSVEVAEHLDAQHHEAYMDNLSRHCSHKLLLTWAVRGQGGTRHVAERDEHEVVPYVRQWGFDFLKEESYRWREIVGQECGYMRNTIYLFQRPVDLTGAASL